MEMNGNWWKLYTILGIGYGNGWKLMEVVYYIRNRVWKSKEGHGNFWDIFSNSHGRPWKSIEVIG